MDQFYGDRTAGVKDPAGNTWWIHTHVEDVSPEEMERRQKEAEEPRPNALPSVSANGAYCHTPLQGCGKAISSPSMRSSMVTIGRAPRSSPERRRTAERRPRLLCHRRPACRGPSELGGRILAFMRSGRRSTSTRRPASRTGVATLSA